MLIKRHTLGYRIQIPVGHQQIHYNLQIIVVIGHALPLRTLFSSSRMLLRMEVVPTISRWSQIIQLQQATLITVLHSKSGGMLMSVQTLETMQNRVY
jgi:hypothetical protein